MFPTATYTYIEHNKYKNHNATNAELNSLVEEPTESKGGTLLNWSDFLLQNYILTEKP